jgi:LysM repeat protein
MNTRFVNFCLVVGLVCVLISVPTPAHAGGFTFTCTNPYIIVMSGGTTMFQVSKTQVAGPLDTAIDTGIHQLIASANGASLWALNSNELQVHWDYNPDGTKTIVSATVCGSLKSYLKSYLFNCTGTGIQVTRGGKPVLSATYDQLAGPLYTAIVSGNNQYITSGHGASLWALKSDEFQVHRDTNPDGTKRIVSADICGVIPAMISTSAPYTPPTTPSTTSTNCCTNGWSTPTTYATTYATTYLVQPGDNLFRISLRFGRTMAQIANANGIVNYSLIYAGQVLIIP